jgi:hypothetical protein
VTQPYSWHKEFYDRALKEMAMTAGKRCEHSFYSCLGWLVWFENNYPEQYKKYDSAKAKITKLWGSLAPVDIEEFKKAVKIEVEATKWVIDKYLKWQEDCEIENEKKGRQEVLAL